MTTHKLQTPWTFYFKRTSEESSGGDYASSIHRIGSFQTAEEFWNYYSHLKRPGDIRSKLEFQMFRRDVRPMWEDEENRDGGRWFIFINSDCASQQWELALLALIGEQVHEDVIGVVISIRDTTDVLSFWTRSGASNTAAAMDVAKSIAKALELQPGAQLRFKHHNDKNNNNRKSLTFNVGETKSKRAKRNQAGKKSGGKQKGH